MDKTTAVVLVAGFFTLVALYVIYRYSRRGKVEMSALGAKLKAEGDNAGPAPYSPAGVRVKDTQAGGSLRAQDSTGRGVDAEKIKAKGDIDLSSSPGGGASPPKR